MTFTREIKFIPAWDRRDDPKGNFGVHDMEILFLLKGPEGTISLFISTQWYLHEVESAWQGSIARLGRNGGEAPSCELATHWRTPINPEDREAEPRGACDFLGGAPCYTSGSYLNAKTLFWQFVDGGEPALWSALESRYLEQKAVTDSWPLDLSIG